MSALEKNNKLFLAKVICFIGFLLGVETGGLQFVLLKAANEFNLSQTEMGSIVTVQFIACTISAVLAGVLADKIGKKKVIEISAMIFAAGSLLITISDIVLLLKVGICGIGLAFGALEATITGALSDSYHEKSGKYISIMQGFLSLGAVVTPVVVNLVMNNMNVGWRLLFWICCIFSVVAVLLTCIARFEAVNPCRQREKPFKIGDKVFVGAVIMIFGYLFIENGTTCFIDSFFVKVIDKPTYSAAALSLFWACMTVSRFVSSTFYEKKDTIIPVACSMAAVVLAYMKFMEVPQVALIGIGVIGFAYGPLSPYLMNIAVERFPEKSGTVSGIMLASSGFGGAVSPVLVGFISDCADLREAYFVVGCVAFIEMLVFCTMIRKKSLI